MHEVIESYSIEKIFRGWHFVVLLCIGKWRFEASYICASLQSVPWWWRCLFSFPLVCKDERRQVRDSPARDLCSTHCMHRRKWLLQVSTFWMSFFLWRTVVPCLTALLSLQWRVRPYWWCERTWILCRIWATSLWFVGIRASRKLCWNIWGFRKTTVQCIPAWF